MQRTSTLYQQEAGRAVAAQGYVRIRFGLTDTDAAATCTPEPSAQAGFTRAASLLGEDAPKSVYATFEPGRMRLDGRQRVAPRRGETAALRAEGFVSAALSDESGAFAAEVPALTLRFSKAHTVPGLTFTFDAVCGDWPAALWLAAYAGETPLLEKTYAPDAAVWTSPDAIERFDRLELRFLRTARPFRRARLQQLLFGFGLVFDSHSVTEASRTAEIDPIGRRLPVNTFEFTVVNINSLTGTGAQYLYDPDNAQGVYRYIGGQSPVRVEYGQRLPEGMTWGDAAAGSWGSLELSGWREVYEGGVTEWVPGGRYYLTGRPTVDGLTARFTAQDALTGLTGTFRKGVYLPAGKSLYELAEEVLSDSGLSPFDPNVPPWRLWEGLADFTTTAPLPAKPHRELLQLIAHAACCVLYTDREGFIRIEPASGAQSGYRLGLGQMLTRPRVSLTPTLRAVECPAYTYLPEEKQSELHKEDVPVDGTARVALAFPQAAEVSVSVEGARVVSETLWAGAAELVLEGSGTARVVVTGRKLAQSKRMVTAAGAENAALPGRDDAENGLTETLDNPLITDAAHARFVAEWVRDWLLLRSTYEAEYRGSPEIDPGDLIRMEHQFSSGPAPARVLRSELSYNGSLRGRIEVKRMVEE